MRGACDSEGAELNRTQTALKGSAVSVRSDLPVSCGVTWAVIPGTSRAGGIKV